MTDPRILTIDALASEREPRRVAPLDRAFRFRLEEHPGAGVEGARFDDRGWELVDLPHTWNAADATSKAFSRGVGWYRLRFRVVGARGDRRAYLRFGAVSIVSTVWLNGRELGTHEGAHSAFCYDVSDALGLGVTVTDPASENVLVVRADNSFRDEVPPRGGDFTMFGGMHGEASLLFTSSLAVDLLDHAGPGVYLTTPEVSADRARVCARVRVRNAALAPSAAAVRLAVTDADGRNVARAVIFHPAPFGVSSATLSAEVEHPRLWQGRVDPYLYSATIEIEDRGTVVDRVRQPLGFRTFGVDPERGFLLNGRPYELRGANLHQDSEEKGSAIGAADRERDFRFLEEMGATFVRLVHYQHAEHAHDCADRLGFVVWAEHGLVNTVSADPSFSERAERQLTELIRQNYNHPSIFAWGIGNEVQTHEPPAAALLLRRLAALVRTEDPNRSSALATCFDEPAGAYGVDLVAHNKYFGWYTGAFDDFAVWLDAQRAKNPTLPMGMAEFGSGAGPGLHSTEPKALDHGEEHQCLFHEAYWRALRARHWVFCKAVWQLFDAASAGRDEGERPGINDKGLVTRDRSIRKDAFFWYKANWSDEPLVYITSRRFTPRDRSSTSVKVYSNCDEVVLRWNGRLLGRREVVDRIAYWPEVELAAGENRIEVEGSRQGILCAEDSCVWRVLG